MPGSLLPSGLMSGSVLLGSVLAFLVGWTPPHAYQTEHFRFRYVAAARGDAEAIARGAESTYQRVVAELGKAPRGVVTVIVVARRAEFRRAQPGGRPFPGWVAGVAYPRRNLIILGPAAPGASRAWRRVLFAHEFSHVALAHAVRFRHLPIWFVEGFADLQALAPFLGSWGAWNQRGALPLGSLHRHLGADGQRASQSYRQSYDLVAFLRSRGDALTFRRFIGRLEAGAPFDQALREVYGLTPGTLEKTWRARWNWRHVLVPMMTSGIFLWVLAALLVVFGFVRQRRRRRAQIAAMDGPDGPVADASDRLAVLSGGLSGWQAGQEPARAPPQAWELDQEHDVPLREMHPVLNMGVLLVATLLAVTLTAILSALWPHTRLWVLAAPSMLLTVLGLRWAAR